MSSPQSTAGWVLERQTGVDGLVFHEQLPLPSLKEDQVLVKIHAASLNYRELAIAKVKTPYPSSYPLVFDSFHPRAATA